MITLKDFEQGATYPPILEASRLGRVTSNRKLYNNDLRPHLEEKEGANSVRVNLFRKAVEIYVNFLLSEGVSIEFGSTTTQEMKERENHLLEVLYLVNTDSKRYGVGVASIDQLSGLFKVYEPDQWYQVNDEAGALSAEVLVEYSDNQLEIPKDSANSSMNYSIITIIVNDYKTNLQTKTVRQLKGGKIGAQVGSTTTLPIIGRQVAPLYSGYAKGQEGTSVFDDIKDIVIDMVRIKQNLSKSLERNSSPHLAAPSGILTTEEGGSVSINTEGMLFPMNPGDSAPFYLQWDTNADAAKFQMEEHWKAYFAITSIPRMIFEPSIGSNSSGEALKRMLFPFLSSLSKLRTANISFIKQLLVMYDNYLLSRGLPRLSSVSPEISINYDEIFIDGGSTDTPTTKEVIKEVEDVST